MTSRTRTLALLACAALGVAACGEERGDSSSSSSTPEAEATAGSEVRVVSPEQAAETIADPPEDLMILDVRTPEEFDQGHIEGAVLLDFYRDDFAEELSTLDPEVPYVLYCRSGNRSSQARAMMADLGFTSVDDIQGGIVGWQDAGLPTVTE